MSANQHCTAGLTDQPLASITALLASVAFLVMGNGLQSTLLPVRASLEHFGEIAIGIMGSAYYLGFIAGCLWGAAVIHRVGHIRAFAALASIASTVSLIHVLSVEPLTWWLLRALTGFCFAGLFLVIETWLNNKADNHNRGFIFGVYTMVNLSVLVLGQIMLVFEDPRGFPLFVFASVLVSLAAVPVTLTRSPQPLPVAETRIGLTRLYRISPVGFLGAGFVGMATGAFWALGPTYVVGIGGGTYQIAVFMAITTLAGAVAQWPIGRLSDRMDRRIVLIAGCVVAATAAGSIVVVGNGGAWIQIVLSCLFGASALPLYAICAAHAFDHTDRSDFIETSTGLLLANGVGAVVGPVAAAGVMEFVGPRGLFLTVSCVYLGLIGFTMWRMTQRAAPSEEMRTEFDLVATAPTVVALDSAQPTLFTTDTNETPTAASPCTAAEAGSTPA